MNKPSLSIILVAAGLLLSACDNNATGEEVEELTPQDAIAAIRDMGGESMTGPFTGNDVLLYLHDSGITDAGLVHVKGLTQLKSLWLDGTAITDSGLAHLEGLKGLENLSLEQTRVTDAGLVHLERLTGLKNLSLKQTQATDRGVIKLKRALPDCSIRFQFAGDRLRPEIEKRGGSSGYGAPFTVSVRGPNTDGVLQELVALDGLSELEVLNLAGSDITDVGLRSLEGLANVSRLDVSRVAVSDAGLIHLKALTGLRWLNLNGPNGITDEGLQHLGELEELEELYLGSTNLTDTGLEHLQGLTKLRKLYLSGTKVTGAGVARLKAVLTACDCQYGSDW